MRRRRRKPTIAPSSPGLMELLGVRLVEGRTFTESDDHHGAPVAIVDERLARGCGRASSAIGRRLGVDPR